MEEPTVSELAFVRHKAQGDAISAKINTQGRELAERKNLHLPNRKFLLAFPKRRP
jgi:hypothetical protein